MEIKKFDFAKYDTDRSGWLSNAEADVARNEGWCIWNGFKEEDSELAKQGFCNFGFLDNKGLLMMVNSKTYQKYVDKVTKYMKELTKDKGRYAMQEWRVGVTYSDPKMQAVLEKAKSMAKKEMKLPDDAFEFGNEYENAHNALIKKIIEDLKSKNTEHTKPSMGLDGSNSSSEQPSANKPNNKDAEPPTDDDWWDDSWDEPVSTTKPATSKPSAPTESDKSKSTPPQPTTPPPTQPAQPNQENGTGSVIYHPPTTNSLRKHSSTDGTFYGDWIERDEYGSNSYEDWLANNGYTYDENTANKLCREAKRNSADGNHRGRCGVAYREAAQAIGIWGNSKRNNSAYQFASELAKNPNFKELPHNIVANMDLTKLPAGCVIVYDAGYNGEDGKDHPHGHISVTTGNGDEYGGGWYDKKNKKHHTTMRIHQEKKNDHIRVFIPVIKK